LRQSISGQGRSGTNWLLELFDQSPETLCRNEPYGAPESKLNGIKDHRYLIRPDITPLESGWDDAAAWTSIRMGARDPRIRISKNYLYEASRRLGLYRVHKGQSFRRWLGAVLPSFRAEEWSVPPWIASPKRIADATAILKLVGAPGWIVFVLNNRPQIPVFHIVRHPGGYLNSWANRWAKGRDMEATRLVNQKRLQSIALMSPEWADHFGEISSMSVERAELWAWIYVNQVIFEAGRSSHQYHHIIYEDLVAEPIALTKSFYASMGLEWSPEIETRVRAIGAASKTIASAWRAGLPAERIELAEEFLAMKPEFYCSGTSS
jgi:hypothetical protein